jgi:hypothetical protein
MRVYQVGKPRGSSMIPLVRLSAMVKMGMMKEGYGAIRVGTTANATMGMQGR